MGPGLIPRCLRGRATVLAAAVLSAGLVGLSPAPAAAASSGIVDTASTTYEVRPATGSLHVTIDKRIANTISSSNRTVPCSKRVYDPIAGWVTVTGTCRQTLTYYVNYAFVWIEKDARNLRFTTAGGTVGHTVNRRSASFTSYRISFPKVLGGQARTIRITYDLRGGKPRSEAWTRIGRAYVNFCAVANGFDRGDVKVIVPSAYDVVVQPSGMPSRTVGTRTVFTSGTIESTSDYYRCFEGTNPGGYAKDKISSASGRTVEVESWPEDKAWRSALTSEVGASLGALERLLGSSLPGAGPVKVREVAASELGYYAGTFDAALQGAEVSEDYAQPGLVAHELSHAWFNGTTLKGRWLSEGLAEWAERAVPDGNGDCPDAGAYPLSSPVDLDTWPWVDPNSPRADQDLVTWNYAAACQLMETISGRIGEARMSAVAAALVARRSVYAADPVARRPGGAADWRDFLDAVDELGMVPAGNGDYAATEQLLLRYGVADATSLDQRAAARRVFHGLLDDAAGWGVPDAIRSKLSAWQFAAALEQLDTARETLSLVRAADRSLAGANALAGPVRPLYEAATTPDDLAAAHALAALEARVARDLAASLADADAALPGIDAGHGPALAAFNAATTPGDFESARATAAAEARAARAVAASVAAADRAVAGIDAANGPALVAFKAATTPAGFEAARQLAADQEAAAGIVAAALEALGAPRDPISELGLTDVDLGAQRDAAVAAARAGKLADARTAAAGIRAALGEAPDLGRSRAIVIAATVGAALLALLAALFLVLRRRRRHRPAEAPVAGRPGVTASHLHAADAVATTGERSGVAPPATGLLSGVAPPPDVPPGSAVAPAERAPGIASPADAPPGIAAVPFAPPPGPVSATVGWAAAVPASRRVPPADPGAAPGPPAPPAEDAPQRTGGNDG